MLSAEELLAGSELTFQIEIPAKVLHPSLAGESGKPAEGAQQTAPAQNYVRLRPLTLRDLQTIARAAKENDTLVATLMVQQALVEPQLSVVQVTALHAGLVQYLLEQVNRISGIVTTEDELTTAIAAPLAKASFILAREFGWTPQQVNELTLGQVLLHLQMLQNGHE